jgi:hypothetical protein
MINVFVVAGFDATFCGVRTVQSGKLLLYPTSDILRRDALVRVGDDREYGV